MGKRRRAADSAAVNRGAITETWQDTMTLLMDTIVMFPIELIQMVGDFAKPACIYWASYGRSAHFKFWRLSLDIPGAVPTMVAYQGLRKWDLFVANRALYVPDGYDGSFFIFWHNFYYKFGIFRFDSASFVCTPIHAPQTHFNVLYVGDLDTVVAGKQTADQRHFYMIKRTEIVQLSIDKKENMSIKEISHASYGHDNIGKLAVNYMDGLATIGTQCDYYQAGSGAWIPLPDLPIKDKRHLLLSVAIVDGCITVVCNNRELSFQLNFTKLVWQTRHNTVSTPATTAPATGLTEPFYLTDSSIVFCDQERLQTKNYRKIKDKPPTPNWIARLDNLNSWTPISPPSISPHV
jgi:hypothetical protein